MSDFVPETQHLRECLLFIFHLKKNAAGAHRMLADAYGEYALSERMCREWFQRFKSGDYDLSNKGRGRPPKKFEDTELQALLDEDSSQTQKQLAEALNVSQTSISSRLHAMGKIFKEGKWVDE